MTRLRFAEAVCQGHPDRLADTIADRIVQLALSRDPDSLVGVEVALHRNVVFVDGRIAAGRDEALVAESEIVGLVRRALEDCAVRDRDDRPVTGERRGRRTQRHEGTTQGTQHRSPPSTPRHESHCGRTAAQRSPE